MTKQEILSTEWVLNENLFYGDEARNAPANSLIINKNENDEAIAISYKNDAGEFETKYTFPAPIKSGTRADRIIKDYIEMEIKVKKQDKTSTLPNKTIPPNQILYGPPGTGKTYNTIDKALEILGFGKDGGDELDYAKIMQKVAELELEVKNDPNNTEKENRNYAKTLFDAYKFKKDGQGEWSGQIAFVTFHQSFSYEDFIEGIAPDLDDDDGESAEIKYEIKDGIFKKIADVAMKNYEDSKKSTEWTERENYVTELFQAYCDYAQERIDDGEPIPLGTKKIFNVNRPKKYNGKAMSLKYNKRRWITLNMTLQYYLDFKDNKLKKDDIVTIESGRYRRDTNFYFKFFENLRDFENSDLWDKNIKTTEKAELKPYILIIDEINRGNISKIFGELITLIEPDKRVGAKEELRAILPYSQESFGVPENLYIIGTMNTADRSVTALDSALRRRFSFVEMMPKPSTLSTDCEGVNLAQMLTAINERIEYHYDRERSIGHAYFMGVDTLDELRLIFKDKIIPLLQEYFYDDYARIKEVLGENKMIKEKEQLKYVKNPSDKKMVYEITDSSEWNLETFKKIYEQQ